MTASLCYSPSLGTISLSHTHIATGFLFCKGFKTPNPDYSYPGFHSPRPLTIRAVAGSHSPLAVYGPTFPCGLPTEPIICAEKRENDWISPTQVCDRRATGPSGPHDGRERAGHYAHQLRYNIARRNGEPKRIREPHRVRPCICPAMDNDVSVRRRHRSLRRGRSNGDRGREVRLLRAERV